MSPLEAHLGHAGGPPPGQCNRVLKHDWGTACSILTACVQLLW